MTDEEFAILARRAGLDIAPEALAWMRQELEVIETLAARLRRPRDLAAEPATRFTVAEDTP